MYTDQGLEAVKTWLNALFRPYVDAAYNVMRVQHGLPAVGAVDTPLASPAAPSPSPPLSTDSTVGHLALFNQHLQKGAQRVEWVYSDHHPFGMDVDAAAGAAPADAFGAGNKTTPVWAAQVLVDGKPLGRGRGNTKKAARNEAAKQGLVRLGVVAWYVGSLILHSGAHPFLFRFRPGSTWSLHTSAGWNLISIPRWCAEVVGGASSAEFMT